jgi:twitching motility two-component system response regulator PilG
MPKIKSVCVVDDAGAMQKLSTKLLESLGVTVFSARDGYEALQVIHANSPDACFIDIEMPVMNGLQLVSILRSSPQYETLPIAVLSGNSSPFDRQKGLLVGADLYLTKPFSKEILSQALSELEQLHED